MLRYGLYSWLILDLYLHLHHPQTSAGLNPCGFSPMLYFFQLFTNITYINNCHTNLIFLPIYGIRIPTQHSKLTCIHGNTITKFIACHYSDRVTSKTPVRFFLFPLFIFFFFLVGGGESTC